MKTNESPLISIYTLSYNSPDIFAAIDSVLLQNYERIQYIIVDDKSNSFEKECIEKYIDKNKRENIVERTIICNKHNLGIIKSSNIALKFSNGKYIFNLAGDDMFADENVISDWVNEFIKTKAQVITAYRDVYDENMLNKLCTLPSEEQVQIIKNSTPKELFEKMVGYNLIFGSCTARTKDFINKFGLFNEAYKLIDDYSMALKISREGQRIEFFERVVIKYRLGGICSATRINKVYWRDSDRIFAREVMPFTENKETAKIEYEKWKQGVKDIQDRSYIKEAREKYKDNSTMLCLAFIKFGIKNPKKGIKKFINKMKKFKSNWRNLIL